MDRNPQIAFKAGALTAPAQAVLAIQEGRAAGPAAFKVPAPVARKVSQMLLIDGQYYWAHPEVAATLAAFFEPDGERITEGYTEEDYQAYLDQNMDTPRLQYYGHYGR